MDKVDIHLITNNWGLVALIIIAFTSGRYILLSGIAYLICYKPGLKRLRKYKIQAAMPGQKQIKNEMFFSCSTIFIFSIVGIVVYILYINGYTTLYSDISEYGWSYFFLSIAAMVLIQDTYFYWTHRLLHKRWFFKKIHTVHHRSANPSPLSAYSFHPLEAMIESLIVFPFVTIFPLNLFAFMLFTFFVLLMNVIGHLGFEFMPKKFRTCMLGKYITSSTHHNLHHQRSNKNFGYYFTFWDKLMKTLQNEISRRPFTGERLGRSNECEHLVP